MAVSSAHLRSASTPRVSYPNPGIDFRSGAPPPRASVFLLTHESQQSLFFSFCSSSLNRGLFSPICSLRAGHMMWGWDGINRFAFYKRCYITVAHRTDCLERRNRTKGAPLPQHAVPDPSTRFPTTAKHRGCTSTVKSLHAGGQFRTFGHTCLHPVLPVSSSRSKINEKVQEGRTYAGRLCSVEEEPVPPGCQPHSQL